MAPMGDTYSTDEAKVRFSEILRKVRAGRHVTISYRGEAIAEVKPIDRKGVSLERSLASLEEMGVVGLPPVRGRAIKALARKPGALARFLKTRD
jgi:prevent-host-death family protein